MEKQGFEKDGNGQAHEDANFLPNGGALIHEAKDAFGFATLEKLREYGLACFGVIAKDPE
jgi:hypothetical protein